MNPTPLYRSEVLEAKRNRWLGRLILRQPISHWVMTWIAIALVSLAVAFLGTGEYARKVRIEGLLVDAVPYDSSPCRDMQGTTDLVANGDHRTLQAQLIVPEGLLASVAVGAEVMLRYPAFPHQRYGQYRGRIVRILRRPIANDTAIEGRSREALPSRYRAVVVLERQRVRSDDDEERDLYPGLGVHADVVVEKRRLYEWLFEPFLLLHERVTA